MLSSSTLWMECLLIFSSLFFLLQPRFIFRYLSGKWIKGIAYAIGCFFLLFTFVWSIWIGFLGSLHP